MTVRLTREQTLAVSRIGGLVLTNALIFQEILAEHDTRIHPVQRLINAANLANAFSEHWEYILREINYYPIFHVAREILGCLTSRADVINALRGLASTAQRVVAMRAPLRHDLMGRVYHRLLAEAKYLGTYYTGIPAAALLLKLALRGANAAWEDVQKLASFRAADLAAGTGTLLMAAADSICDLHIRARNRRDEPPDLPGLHRILIENVLHGFDVLETAVHLTASTLALRAPQITFTKMCLFSLPLGGSERRLGSIEFLLDREISVQLDLFGSALTASHATPTGLAQSRAPLPDLDLCVMNPPFVRSVGGNLLFGSVPEGERRPMQQRLARILRQRHALASTTAGLGSVFVAVADTAIKPGGRLALVLPKALLSGVAWDRTRELLRQRYRLEYVVASHDPLQWNFSESTSLSEVLLVAVKLNPMEQGPDVPVTAINLMRNPRNTFEALAIEAGLRGAAPDLKDAQGALSVQIGGETYAEGVSLPWQELKEQTLWILPSAFAQADLIRVAYNLLHNRLWLPGQGVVGELATCPLQELGNLGPDRRDIHDGFRLATATTAYPALWGHDAADVVTLKQEPNRHLSPLSRAQPGRPLRRVEQLWPLAGRLMIAERMRLNTSRLACVRLEQPALSNTWWSFASSRKRTAIRFEKGLALWLNSTLGLISLLARRAETEGAWVDFKKPVLEQIQVPDLRTLAPKRLDVLALAFDRLSDKGLSPLPEMAQDPIRGEVDSAIAKALGLPEFLVLRNLLAREPVVCLRRL